MTDLTHRDNAHPVIAMNNPPEHIVLLSLLTLSLVRVAHRLRGAALVQRRGLVRRTAA